MKKISTLDNWTAYDHEGQILVQREDGPVRTLSEVLGGEGYQVPWEQDGATGTTVTFIGQRSPTGIWMDALRVRGAA